MKMQKNLFRRFLVISLMTSCSTSIVRAPEVNKQSANSVVSSKAHRCASGPDSRSPTALTCQDIFDDVTPDPEVLKREWAIILNQKPELTSPQAYREYGVFHEMPAATFVLDGSVIEIKKPFEVMATPLTQWAWYRLVNLTRVQIDPAPSRNRPPDAILRYHPVENFSPLELVKLIESVNRISSQDAFQPFLKSIFYGHKKGMIYDLPTFSEMQAVFTNGGKNSSRFVVGDNPGPLNRVAVLNQSETQPVATRSPIVFDGDRTRNFYDLTGNLRQMTKNKDQPFFTATGVPFSDNGVYASRTIIWRLEDNQRSGLNGVRLIRRLP